MNPNIIRYCLPVLLLISITEANISNDGETRQPRGSGRLVKLNSGVRPDPIACTNEGFKGDPNDCAVFYRCTKSGRGKYIAYGFRCPPGTVYDPDIEVCNHPQNTKRSECGGFKPPTSPHYEVNEINEVQELPSPISTAVPIYTPLTTEKDSVLSTHSTISQKPTTIKWQSSRSTTIRSTSTGHNEITAYPWILNSQNSFLVTSSTIPNNQQFTREDICTSDGFMGDSVNCHKFYRCVGNQRSGFTKFEFSCSEPTIWDDDIKSCNHPWAVKRSRCGRSNTQNMHGSTGPNTIPGASTANANAVVNSTVSSITSSNTKESDKTIQNQLQISYGTNVHQSQMQISNNPIIQNQTQINYGDKDNNKQSQNQVSHGSAVSQSQTQISYGNEVVQTQVQIDHSKQSSQSQVQITESTTLTSKSTKSLNQKVNENTLNVNNTCSQSGFMADYNDCKKFYRCVDNGRGGFIRHDFSCGEGTLWDQTIESCNHAWAVKECGGISSRPHSQETPTMVSHFSTTHTYSSTTSKSIENYSSSTTEVTQPDDFNDIGYNNNHAISSSVSVTKPTTEIIHHVDTKCISSGFVGDAKDCQIFYSCVENDKGGYTKYAFKCDEGTLWDTDIGACNHAWAVKRCGENVLSTTIETTSIKPTTTTSKLSTNPYTTSSESHLATQNDDFNTGYGIHNEQTSSIATTSIIPPLDHNVGNKCQSSGFMGDENDCKKFYRCVDNGNGTYARYEFTCGDGTAWDSKIEGCNHAWAVDCKVNSLSTSTTETTTQKKPVTIYEEIEGGYNVPESDNDIGLSTQKTTTTMKVTDSDINDSNCRKSGFIGDITDCTRFYRCVDKGDGSFIRYEFTCGEGTVWDQKIEACNHEGVVGKCGSDYGDNHGIATTSAYNVTMSDDKPVHGYPTPGYPEHENEINNKTTQTTTTITSTPMTSTYCKTDGFIGDESDCKIFYRCVNDSRGGFIKYEYKCGKGTVWDQSIEACNHVWAVKECRARNETTHDINDSTSETMPITSSEHYFPSTEKITSTTDSTYDNEISNNCAMEGFIGDSKDCKKFYRCVSNGHGGYTKYEFTCGEGTYWNQIIQACDYASPENPCKGNGNSIVTKEPHHVNDESEITTKVTLISTSESLGDTSESSTKIPQSIRAQCDSEGFFGDLRDCQKFYRCVNDGKGGYNKYDFTCGEGTIWDQELTTCVHKAGRNNCSSNFTENSSQPNGSEENDNLYTSTTTSKPHQTSTEKQSVSQQTSTENILSGSYQCISEGFYANPKDCRKFIRCVGNGKGTFTKYDFSCGEGTVWVQELLACEHDDGPSSCHKQSEWTTKPQIITEITTQTNTASSATTVHTQAPNKDDDNYHTETTKGPQIINGDCQSEGLYADKDDCKKYYRCVQNNGGEYIKHEFICGEKTAWDTILQTCNHDSVVSRCHGSYQPNNQTESVIHDEISETTESSTTSTTPASTTESKDNENGAGEDTCHNEGFFGNTKYCDKFYRCVDNGKGGFTKYDFTCGEGTIWDQDLLTCNHPHDVVNPSCNHDHGASTESTTTSSGTTSTSTSATQSTQSATTQSPSSTTTTQASGNTASTTENFSNCTQEETSKKPGNKNVTCDKAGYYPDPNDCKKFYRCVDWDGKGEKFSVYFFECGEGTIWDPALDTCNHEESVYPPRDCSNKEPQNTTESTTTTSEQTTTQQSSTSEQTTTQQSTTSEQTTAQQPTSSEQTTTQQSTTSETTTTQHSTTNEQTTTQQSTTSEQTTTQQFTTSEQTTTQQPTTSEQTTTQQSTISEPTTTQHSTTNEQTTQQSTTSEQTTMRQYTTTEQTTTQQSTTSEQTTTQQSTASEQNTTEESTTVGSTTQQPTTETEGVTEAINSSTTTDSTTTLTNVESTVSSTTSVSSSEATTTENQQETTTENNSNSSSCPDTAEDQHLFVCPTSFRRHPKYCNLFYQCTEEDDSHEVKVAVFNCPNNTIYDESKIQCVAEDKAEKKCDGEIASRRRVKRVGASYKEPIMVTKDPQKCSTVGHMPFEKNSECSPAFLKCEKSRSGTLRGFVHRCPQNYLYWSISRRCEREEVIRDCKRTINNWSGRWEIPIDRHNVAW